MKWITLCKRTEEPKLSWIEMELDKLDIPHQRNGKSWHAPILEVPEDKEMAANAILMRRIGRYTVDDIRDDHPRWLRELLEEERIRDRATYSEWMSAAVDYRGRP